MTNDQKDLERGDKVRILVGTRAGQEGTIAFVRMAPPEFSKVEACSVLCADGRAAMYLAKDLVKV